MHIFYSRPTIPVSGDKLSLQSCLEQHCGRKARVSNYLFIKVLQTPFFLTMQFGVVIALLVVRSERTVVEFISEKILFDNGVLALI